MDFVVLIATTLSVRTNPIVAHTLVSQARRENVERSALERALHGIRAYASIDSLCDERHSRACEHGYDLGIARRRPESTL